ncbi:MAG: DNA-binding protein [Clostridia bacterium]|nr:DNA-binding protein [Clostridia bacterium]
MEARIRTVQQAFKEIKEADPDTAVTEYMVRKIVYSGEIPTVRTGNKRLFDLDELLHYLKGGRP